MHFTVGLALLLFTGAASRDHCPKVSPADSWHRFARMPKEQGFQAWRDAACPAEMTSYTCNFHDFRRGWEIENTPADGVCQPFDFHAFQRVARNRMILITGDSVMVQFWQALVCMMPRHDAEFRITWHQMFHDGLCPFGAEHCYIHESCAYFPTIPVHICVMPDCRQELTPDWLPHLGLKPEDVVIFNAGFHIHQRPELVANVKAVLHTYKTWNGPAPHLLWFETPAQHFNYHPNGYYPFDVQHDFSQLRCAPLDLEVAYQKDWKNRLTEQLVTDAKISIIRTYNVSAQFFNAHVDVSGRHPERESHDCTHWCLPGVPLLWAQQLVKTLHPSKATTADFHNSSFFARFWDVEVKQRAEQASAERRSRANA